MECNGKHFFSDVTVTLDKRDLLVFLYTADIRFTYYKPRGLGGFASEGNHNALYALGQKLLSVDVW